MTAASRIQRLHCAVLYAPQQNPETISPQATSSPMRHFVLFIIAAIIMNCAAIPAAAGLMVTFSAGGKSATIFDENPVATTSGSGVTATGDLMDSFSGFLATVVKFDFNGTMSGVQGYTISFSGDSNSPGDTQEGRLHEFVTTIEGNIGTVAPLTIQLFSDGFDSPGANGSVMTLLNHLESVEFKSGGTGSVSYQSATDTAATAAVSTTTDVNDLVSSVKFTRGATYKLIGTTTISLNTPGRVDIEANTIAHLPEAGSMVMWGILVFSVGAIVFVQRRKQFRTTVS